MQGKCRLQYFVAVDMQTIQEESYEENNDLHDDNTELHEQPWRVQHRIFLPKQNYIYFEVIIAFISFLNKFI